MYLKIFNQKTAIKRTSFASIKKNCHFSHVTHTHSCQCILGWGGLLTLMRKVLVQNLENCCNHVQLAYSYQQWDLTA